MGEDIKTCCSGTSKFNNPILCHSGSMFKDILASRTVKRRLYRLPVDCLLTSWPVADECRREAPRSGQIVGDSKRVSGQELHDIKTLCQSERISTRIPTRSFMKEIIDSG